MANTSLIKLPEIPRGVSPELSKYFITLHLNIKALEERIRLLEGK